MSDAVQSNVEASPPRVQFGLRTLLALPVVVAVGLVLLKHFDMLGLLAVFVAVLVLQFAPAGDRKSAARRLAVDLAWGIVMPILCLLYDPGFFRESGSLGTFGYLVVCTEMLLLFVWLVVGRTWRWLSAMFCGGLALGVLTAAVVGVLILPICLIGIIIGVGALGLTPWMTASVFWRNATQADKASRLGDTAVAPALIMLGFAIALAVPTALYLTVGDAFAGWLQSADWLWPRSRF